MLLTCYFKQDPLVQYVCGILWIQAAQGLGCSGFGMLLFWDALGSGCSRFRLLWVWDAPGSACSTFRVLWIWPAAAFGTGCGCVGAALQTPFLPCLPAHGAGIGAG